MFLEGQIKHNLKKIILEQFNIDEDKLGKSRQFVFVRVDAKRCIAVSFVY